MQTKIKFIVVTGLSLLITACQYLQEPVTPLKMEKYDFDAKKENLLILIPGIADTEKTFSEKGFIQRIKNNKSTVDVIAAHIHLGYLMNDSFVTRIEQDIILPARKEGYKNIWIAGISLGGFVALNYVQARPTDIKGVLLLAPFLGEDSEIKIIRQAGGIHRWQPNNIETLSRTLKLWFWYQQRAKENKLQNIYLGYGNSDHLRSGIEQFARLIPQENIKVVSGGHNWECWSQLWQEFLDRNIFKPH